VALAALVLPVTGAGGALWLGACSSGENGAHLPGLTEDEDAGGDASHTPTGAIIGGGSPTSTKTTSPTGTTPPAVVCKPPKATVDAGTDAGADAGTCAASSVAAKPPPLGLYLMVDRSGSMQEMAAGNVTKWQALGTALGAVLGDASLAGAAVGLQFFPALDTDSCAPSVFADPAVELQTLPGARSALLQAVSDHNPAGSTPTGPALTGAIAHLQSWGKQHPNHSLAVVLATDGMPTTCEPTAIADIAQIAAAGVKATPSVPTFVIGIVGSADVQSGALANLGAIAAGGGTTNATLVGITGDLSSGLADALRQVALRSVSCSLALPPPAVGVFDPGKVNVSLSDKCGSGPVVYVRDQAHCAQGDWSYDADPDAGGVPSRILLCPDACTRYQNGAQVTIEVGCATKTAPS
jgi:hypothetical protein